MIDGPGVLLSHICESFAALSLGHLEGSGYRRKLMDFCLEWSRGHGDSVMRLGQGVSAVLPGALHGLSVPLHHWALTAHGDRVSRSKAIWQKHCITIPHVQFSVLLNVNKNAPFSTKACLLVCVRYINTEDSRNLNSDLMKHWSYIFVTFCFFF